MTRKETLRKQAEALVDENRKPTVQGLAQDLGWIEEDVHSCLNSMEKKGEVETYVKEVLGRKTRFVSLKR